MKTTTQFNETELFDADIDMFNFKDKLDNNELTLKEKQQHEEAMAILNEDIDSLFK